MTNIEYADGLALLVNTATQAQYYIGLRKLPEEETSS